VSDHNFLTPRDESLAAAVSVGDKFPTTPVVHVGFPKAKTIAELLEGKSKVLFVSLPGAFTPT